MSEYSFKICINKNMSRTLILFPSNLVEFVFIIEDTDLSHDPRLS